MRRAVSAMVVLAVAARIVRARFGLPVSRYVVEGPSMEPAFRSGDRLLVNRMAYRARDPLPGDVVVLHDPERRGHVLLKRVGSAPDGGAAGAARLYVLGDNLAESRDSRAFGLVARDAIIGRAWLKY